MGMIALYNIVQTINGMAISLGVGGSTFALIFHFMGMRSTVAHDVGRPYQKVVYVVLRVAMVLIFVTEATKISLYLYTGTPLKVLLGVSVLTFLWTVIAVLFINPVLMTFHLMSNKLGPAIQAASWYTLGTLVSLQNITYAYLPLVLTYLGGILAIAVVIELISQKMTVQPSLLTSADAVTTSVQ